MNGAVLNVTLEVSCHRKKSGCMKGITRKMAVLDAFLGLDTEAMTTGDQGTVPVRSNMLQQPVCRASWPELVAPHNFHIFLLTSPPSSLLLQCELCLVEDRPQGSDNPRPSSSPCLNTPPELLLSLTLIHRRHPHHRLHRLRHHRLRRLWAVAGRFAPA